MKTLTAPEMIRDDLRAELAAIAAEEDCELLEIEHHAGVLRFVIDHPDGVTVEHCESISRQASALLDVEDVGAGRYVLEVSSPGLDRKLHGPRDYERFLGRLARITFRGDDGRRRTVVGELRTCAADTAALSLRNRESGRTTEIPHRAIEKARLEIDL